MSVVNFSKVFNVSDHDSSTINVNNNCTYLIKLLWWLNDSYLWSDKYGNLGYPCGSDGKEPACKAEDPGSIPGLGRSPAEGHGNSLQYSYLENPMDRED